MQSFYPKELCKEVVQCIMEGFDYDAVADKVGIKYNHVAKIVSEVLHTKRSELRKHGKNGDDVDEVLDLYWKDEEVVTESAEDVVTVEALPVIEEQRVIQCELSETAKSNLTELVRQTVKEAVKEAVRELNTPLPFSAS